MHEDKVKANKLYYDANRYLKANAENKYLELLNQAAQLGCIDAQFDLGVWYKNGEVRDYTKAMYWLNRVINTNNKPDAIYELGLCYLYTNEHIKAFETFLICSKLKHIEGLNELAKCYFDGIGVIENIRLAKHYWKKAAKKGNDNAKYYLQRLKNAIK